MFVVGWYFGKDLRTPETPFFHARHGEFKKTLRKPQELFSDNEWQAFGVCLSVMQERYSSFTTSVLDLLRGPFVFAQSTLWYSSNWCPCSAGVGVGGRFRIADVDRLMIEALLDADFWRTTWLATLQLVALPFPEEDAARCKDRCNDMQREWRCKALQVFQWRKNLRFKNASTGTLRAQGIGTQAGGLHRRRATRHTSHDNYNVFKLPKWSCASCCTMLQL